MVSKYNKTEVYQECTSVFFVFVQDVLRPLMVYSIILLSDKNKLKALYLFIHRCCSRFTYPWAWFSVLNCKHYKMCLF